jgi:4-amino-4-deoxy-L-arabinose transferase-like glycosyltransferase
MRNKWVLYAGLAAIFLLTRFFLLQSLPIFNDESMYLRWGWEYTHDTHYWSLATLLDGKQPGWPILLSVFVRLGADPLVTGRTVSILFGLITFLSILEVAQIYLLRKNIVWLAFFLLVTPFLIFFDRLTLAEAVVTASYTVSFLVLIKNWAKPDLGKGVLLGAVLACGWWMKSTILLAFPSLCLLFVLQIFFNRADKEKFTEWVCNLISIVLGFFVCILPLLSHPLYHNIVVREQERVLPLVEVLHFPFSLWFENITHILIWFSFYLTPGIFLLFCVGIGQIFYRLKKILPKVSTEKDGAEFFKHLSLLLWCLSPVIYQLIFARHLTSRYLTLVVPFVLLISIIGLTKISKGKKFIGGISWVIGLICSVLLIVNPLRLYLMVNNISAIHLDLGQYMETSSSGYGVREAAEWIQAHKDPSKKTFVIIRGDSGNPEDGMYLFLYKDPQNIVLPTLYLPRVDREIATTEQRASSSAYTPSLYFVSRGNQFDGLEKRLLELQKFPHPMSDSFVGVYKIQPE